MYYLAGDPTFPPHSTEGFSGYFISDNFNHYMPVWNKLENALNYLKKNSLESLNFGVVPGSDEFMKRKMEEYKFKIKFMDSDNA